MRKSTLLALGVFVVLAVAGLLSLRKPAERGISRLALTHVRADQVDKIEIAGPKPVELVRDGDTWRLANGKEADVAQVQRFLDFLPKFESSDLVTTDSTKFEEMELDEEKGHRVTLSGKGSTLASFMVGKAARGGSYVLHSGEVYAVSGMHGHLIAKEASAWLQRKLFSYGGTDVSRLEVQLAGQAPYALISKDDQWELEDPSILPEGFRFDANQARTLVTAVTGARARDILDTDPGEETTGFAQGDAWVLHVSEKDGKPATTLTLRLGNALESGEIYARVDGRDDVVTLAKHTGGQLRKQATDLRDLKMFSFDAAKARALDIVDGAMSISFTKQDGTWKLAKHSEKKPEGFDFDPGSVDRRLSSLANLRAQKVAPEQAPAQTGLARPKARVVVTLEGGEKASLLLGDAAKDDTKEMFYAQGNLDDAVYWVNKWTRDRLFKGLESFKVEQAAPSGLQGLDPQALSNLPPEVRASLMQQIEQQKQQEKLLEQLKAQQAQ